MTFVADNRGTERAFKGLGIMMCSYRASDKESAAGSSFFISDDEQDKKRID